MRVLLVGLHFCCIWPYKPPLVFVVVGVAYGSGMWEGFLVKKHSWRAYTTGGLVSLYFYINCIFRSVLQRWESQRGSTTRPNSTSVLALHLSRTMIG